MTQNQRNPGLNDQAAFWGFLVGLLLGGIVTLFRAPQAGKTTLQRLAGLGQTVRDKLENATPTDPVMDSMAVGKAAARRRLEELGLNNRN